MSRNPVKSSRNLSFGGITLFAIVVIAAISATVVKVSLSAIIPCPYCDSAFLQFIESEEQLRDHMLKAHGRELSFAGKSLGEMPVRSEEDRER